MNQKADAHIGFLFCEYAFLAPGLFILNPDFAMDIHFRYLALISC